MILRLNLCKVLFIVFLPVCAWAQDSQLIKKIEKLPAKERTKFIGDHLKTVSKTDTAEVRKQTLLLLEHFKKDNSIYAYLLTQRATQLFKAKNNNAAIDAQTRAMDIYERLKDTENEL